MKKYIASLDGLRGLGIAFVIFYHILRLRGDNPTIFGFSWIFIQMFFVQSGYLITKILVGLKEKDLGTYLKMFYWNRVLRIFPVYFAYLFLLVGLHFIFNAMDEFLQVAPFLFSYTFNFTRLFESIHYHPLYVHLWSLSVEEQFYLIWPFLVYFLSARQLQFLIVTLFLCCPVVRYLLADVLVMQTNFDADKIGEAVYGFTFSHFDAFAAGGAIVAFNLEEKKHFAWKGMSLTCFVGVAGLSLNHHFSKGVYDNLSWTSLGLQESNLANLQHFWSYTLVNFFFLLVTLILIQPGYKGLFTWKPLTVLGKMVYSIYIFHFIILMIVDRVAGQLPVFIQFVIALTISSLAGYLSYNFFEKRFLKFKY